MLQSLPTHEVSVLLAVLQSTTQAGLEALQGIVADADVEAIRRHLIEATAALVDARRTILATVEEHEKEGQ